MFVMSIFTDFIEANISFFPQEIDKKNNFDDMRPFWRKLGDLGLLGITASSKVKVCSTFVELRYSV